MEISIQGYISDRGGFKDQTVGQTFGIPHRVSFDVVDRLSSKVLSSYRREDVNIITVNPFGRILFAFRAEPYSCNAEESKERLRSLTIPNIV